MKVDKSKTDIFVIHSNRENNENMHIDGLVVERCAQYVYLGSPFTADGSVSSSVRVHADVKRPHVIKFVSFLNKNNDIPFRIEKKRVFEACLMSTILYGSESWLNADQRLIKKKKLYNWSLRNYLT